MSDFDIVRAELTDLCSEVEFMLSRIGSTAGMDIKGEHSDAFQALDRIEAEHKRLFKRATRRAGRDVSNL